MAIRRPEKIVSAAILVGDMAFSAPPPARHHTLLHALHEVSDKLFVGPSQQGFLTSAGRYVGREEALKIALAAKQIEAPKFQPHHLFSEDLW